MKSNDFYSIESIVDYSQLWKNCLSSLKKEIPALSFSTWFKPLDALGYADNKLKVAIPDPFFLEWIDEHYGKLLEIIAHQTIGPNARIEFVVQKKHETGDTVDKKPLKIRAEVAPQRPFVKQKPELAEKPDHKPNLNTKYLFSSFVTGEGNILAYEAAKKIAQQPAGTSFNPLVLYGGVGLGKTHLIQAIGNYIIDHMPKKKVVYVSSEKFTVDFVEAIQKNNISDFSAFYRNMDILILDDIQFLIGKERTQDLFFSIFNTLHQSGKQIILSSDKPPKDLRGLDDRLISRFQWGLVADITPPEYETRLKILKQKAQDYGLKVSLEILEYIAERITSNIRELEGCLIKLMASASLENKKISLELAKKSVKIISTSSVKSITIDSITKVVCDNLGIDEKKIRDKSRKKEIVRARHIAMYLSKTLTSSSLKNIGLHFGGRDHSTVIHSCNTVENEMNNDIEFHELIDSIKTKIDAEANF